MQEFFSRNKFALKVTQVCSRVEQACCKQACLLHVYSLYMLPPVAWHKQLPQPCPVSGHYLQIDDYGAWWVLCLSGLCCSLWGKHPQAQAVMPPH